MGEWGFSAAHRRSGVGRLHAALLLAFGLLFLTLGRADAFPGANGKIVFSSNRDGDFDIYLVGSPDPLTSNSTRDTQPAFSPDGGTIAYECGDDICTLPTRGGTPNPVGGGEQPAWSPTGERIAFVRGGDIRTMDANGGSEDEVTDGGPEDQTPAWSPDGDRIAFARKVDGIFEIYSVEADGGSAPVNLTESGRTEDVEPAWSPDGDKIAFIRDGDLYVMNEDGTGQTRITTSGGASDPAWSPNGELIVLEIKGDIWTVPAAGGARTIVVDTPSVDQQPDWATSVAITTDPKIIAGDPDKALPSPLPDGITLTVVPGTAISSEPGSTITTSYQWLRCDANGANCADIAGATAESYKVQSADVNFRIRVRQLATTAAGTASALSDATPVVAASKPINVTDPTVSVPTGGVIVGQTLTANAGTWAGSEPRTISFQWLRCEKVDDLSSCKDIDNATASTYVLTSEDQGKFIRVRVTASNAVGSESDVSAATDAVLSAVPFNVTPPVISGTFAVGQTVSVTPGEWLPLGVPLFYQWQRCNAEGASCTPIPGATRSTYTIVATDAGFRLKVVVTARNSAGATTKEALAPETVAVAAPVNTFLPTITGIARVGNVLTVSNGSWTGAPPITFTYQWLRCDDDDCVEIAGATRNTYTVTSADVGRTLMVEVTATNAGGSTTVETNETAEVTATGGTTTITTGRPSNTSAPQITGTPALGQTLLASVGSWNGSTPMTFTYVWQRCESTGSPCLTIFGATAASYRVTTDDIGKRLRVTVTASNSLGSAVATSPLTAIVTRTPTTTQTGGTAGVRTLVGTARADRLFGGPTRDVILGMAGNDLLFGRAGNDRLSGGPGNDRLAGEAGVDLLHGDSGRDVLFGGSGADSIFGDSGNDKITGGAGRDRLRGGLGHDSINARDGEVDDVDCGPGFDVAFVDRSDRVRNCEIVHKRKPKRPATRNTTKRNSKGTSSPTDAPPLAEAARQAVEIVAGRR